MKRKLYTILLACIGGSLCSCGSDTVDEIDDSNDNSVVVEITTEIQTRATVVKEFAAGDEMNIFAKTFNKTDAPDLISEIKGTFDGTKWNTNPLITLKEGERTFIYAYSPYENSVATVTNLAAIPVDVTQQKDIMYSGSAIPVSHTTHQAKLTMKHALALFTVNIMSQGYNGEGKLQNMSLLGEQVYATGLMNIENGKIEGVETGNLITEINKQIQNDGWQEELPRLWCIPFSTKLVDASLKALIDGKEFQVLLPEIEMKSGFQYIFHMILTDRGLVFIPDQTETISLNQDNDTMNPLELYGVLQIEHQATTFTAPRFLGDNIFGNITWGDNTTDSYAIGLQHEYTAGTWQCVFETWNSTGFELDNIIGIETIDISQY